MKRHASWILLWVLLFSIPVFSQERSISAIGEAGGRTDVYVVDSGIAGPVVMIVAGIHGNEISGPGAAEQIRHWPLERGKLIIVPEANRPALKKNSRKVPGAAKDIADLNRNFPKTQEEKPKCSLSKAIWELGESQKPDWLLDLHEGRDFTQMSTSVGSSIISGKSPEAKKQAQKMLDSVNETIAESKKKFILKSPPVKGSLARSASDLMPTKVLILETTRKDQPVSLRVRQHRIMVHRFLSELEMISSEVDPLVEMATEDKQFFNKRKKEK